MGIKAQRWAVFTTLLPISDDQNRREKMTTAVIDLCRDGAVKYVFIRPLYYDLFTFTKQYPDGVTSGIHRYENRPVLASKYYKIPWLNLGNVIKLWWTLRSTKAVGVTAHMFDSIILVAILKLFWSRLRFKAVLHSSDVGFLQHPIKRVILRYALTRAESVGFRSHGIRRRVEALCPLDNAYPEILFSGVDISCQPAPVVAQSETRHQLTLVCVGKLTRRKNIDLVVHALHRIGSRLGSWRLIVIGQGEERDTLERLAAELGLTKRIMFLGWQPKATVVQYYRHAQCLVLPSAPETLGLVYLEALSCGCLVLGTKEWGVWGHVPAAYSEFVNPSIRGVANGILAIVHKRQAVSRQEVATYARKHFDPKDAAAIYERFTLTSSSSIQTSD